MKVSLLISTYNWPKALELVLKSAERQSVEPLEILIADDGSSEETKTLIENFAENSKMNIRHFWHEDSGFRKAIILNKAIANSYGDYIIQVDGDCIMHSDFIKDHLSCAENNTYLFGSRVTIVKKFLPTLFAKNKVDFHFWSKGIKKRTRTFRIPMLAKQYQPNTKMSKKVRGCNISYWRKDLISINGYNEDFVGWGREDSEMVIRMMNNGVKGKRLRYGGIVYHIYHPIKDKSNLQKNNQLEELTKSERAIRCENGIDKYL